jgi:hypothetical protein
MSLTENPRNKSHFIEWISISNQRDCREWPGRQEPTNLCESQQLSLRNCCRTVFALANLVLTRKVSAGGFSDGSHQMGEENVHNEIGSSNHVIEYVRERSKVISHQRGCRAYSR